VAIHRHQAIIVGTRGEHGTQLFLCIAHMTGARLQNRRLPLFGCRPSQPLRDIGQAEDHDQSRNNRPKSEPHH
jgi:hypothetical protein